MKPEFIKVIESVDKKIFTWSSDLKPCRGYYYGAVSGIYVDLTIATTGSRYYEIQYIDDNDCVDERVYRISDHKKNGSEIPCDEIVELYCDMLEDLELRGLIGTELYSTSSREIGKLIALSEMHKARALKASITRTRKAEKDESAAGEFILSLDGREYLKENDLLRIDGGIKKNHHKVFARCVQEKHPKARLYKLEELYHKIMRELH